VDVLKAIRPIKEDETAITAVRGQYGPGWIEGQKVSAYRGEPNVDQDSRSETFAALKLFIDNWRWQDVPFYLRTGKRLAAKVTEIVINFKPVPHQSFPKSAALAWQSNRLIMHIQPQEGIILGFQAKLPGMGLQLNPVNMHFSYQEAFKTRAPEAYETLLEDVFSADATLFMRADQVEASWKVLAPILMDWEASIPVDFPNYQAGTWGPGSAEELIARDGRSWLEPTLDELPEENPPINSNKPTELEEQNTKNLIGK